MDVVSFPHQFLGLPFDVRCFVALCCRDGIPSYNITIIIGFLQGGKGHENGPVVPFGLVTVLP